MVKIIYVVSTLRRTGPINQLYNLIKYLDRSRFCPHIITLSSEPADSRWADYNELGVQMHCMNLSRLAGVFLAKSRLKILIRNIQPDLIHTQGIRGDILSTCLTLKIPRVCTIRNIPQQDYPNNYGEFIASLMLWCHARAMYKMTACVGVSKAVYQNLINFIGCKNILTIHNGVDRDLYFPSLKVEKAIIRKNLGLPLDVKLWVASGYLSSLKDPLFLIEMWKYIYGKNNVTSHLLFLGSGELERDCRVAAESYKNVHILGQVANVSNYLRASDYFVSASSSEGLPNAVLEALACGLPVLLSDIPPHREIWEFSSNCGEVFRLGDRKDFMLKLDKIISMNREQMSINAIELITKKLCAKRMSAAYQNLYEELILDRGRQI